MRCCPRPPGRARVLVPAAGIILTLIAAGCGSSHVPAGPASPASSAGTPAASSPAVATPHTLQPSSRTGTWQLLPPVPVPARLMFTVSVWTGRQMLIHGIATAGTGFRGVTFGYTPATGTWRMLAPGPVPLMAQNNDE